MDRKKQLTREYREGKRPMGVFLIRNNKNDKIFVASGLDLNGAINRQKFQLNGGLHRNKHLQQDWNSFGAENFAFEVVDEMMPGDFDPKADLEALENLWLQKLRPYAERGYNDPKLSRTERLKRIAASREHKTGD